MPETDVDRRGYGIVLVSHSVLNGSIVGAADPVSAAVVAWADAAGLGVYQLPVPDHLLPAAPDGSPGEDRANLEFVFGQLASYRAGGYTVAGLVLRTADERSAAGRAFVDLVLQVARDTGVDLPRLWRLPRGARSFDPEADRFRHPRTLAVAS
ncbi:MAG: hypothetical protein VB093_01470 [Propionicimonas sp.]|nr:hypothetical protein [Propionicimonas sp.]MEA5118021.1 hypothetical protein [Propionicimonas sp.]